MLARPPSAAQLADFATALAFATVLALASHVAGAASALAFAAIQAFAVMFAAGGVRRGGACLGIGTATRDGHGACDQSCHRGRDD